LIVAILALVGFSAIFHTIVASACDASVARLHDDCTCPAMTNLR
jgi:hypothetical protein